MFSAPEKQRPIEQGPQVLTESRFSAANRRRLSAPALRTFLTIADLWNLNEVQRLLVLSGKEKTAIEWLRMPHHAIVFGGYPPLDVLTSGTQDGLMTVRRFLDAARGGLYMPPNEIDRAFKPFDETEIVFR